MNPVILTFSEHYLPAYKAGGTPRTLGNMTGRLGRELSFRIVTRDRDLGDDRPFPDCDGEWKQVGQADVLYLSPQHLGIHRIRRLLEETSFDIVYLNSCFSRYFSMLPLALTRLRPRRRRKPVVLAPRGEFSKGALSIHGGRKSAWLRTARALSLFDDVLWQASSSHEATDIRRVIGPAAAIRIAPDLTTFSSSTSATPRAKTPGSLRIAQLGRISPIKNIVGALEMLQHVRGDVDLHVMGPASDAAYLAACQAQAAVLPPNVRVHFEGAVAPDEVHTKLEGCHVLLAMTHAENFGHVILEALMAGCLPIVSDRTPWRGLTEAGVGWDLPLERLNRFREAVQECIDLDAADFAARSEKARRYAEAVHRDDTPRQQNLALFREACDAGARASTTSIVPSALTRLR